MARYSAQPALALALLLRYEPTLAKNCYALHGYKIIEMGVF